MPPKVSICIPNLNNRPYLPERFETIFSQTFQDWELIVVDNCSQDGAWEYICETAARDPRIKISQAPRAGLYANWNNCIRQARGEYVYIATSDDTMMPECLQKMVAALESNPACGLCQCGLEVIDSAGRPHPWMQWRRFAFGRFAPEWLDRRQIRRAPLDGILHCALQTIYSSITQLLVRRRVFDRIGLFDTTWGAKGDFEWGMRAGLVEDCIFIPDVLATWRVHPNQATGDTESSAVRRELWAMSRVAFERARKIAGNKLAPLPTRRLFQFYLEQLILFGLQEAGSRPRRILFLIGEILHGNRQAWNYILDRRQAGHFQEYAQFKALRDLIQQLNIPAPVSL